MLRGVAMDLTAYEKRGYLVEDYRLFRLAGRDAENIDWHYHDFHKIIVFLGGTVQYAIEGKRYDLCPDDVVLVPRGSIHRPEPTENEYRRVIIYLSPDYLRAHSTADCDLETCFRRAQANYQFVLRPTAQSLQPTQLLKQLEYATDHTGFGQQLLCRALMLQFLIALTRSMDERKIQFVSDAAYDEKTVAIVRYLHEHLEEDLSIDRIADAFFISKSHMMRRFKAETGYTIHGYLTEKRLLAARDRISSGIPITEAAFRSGFRDYSAFARAYKKQFGEMPKLAAKHPRT